MKNSAVVVIGAGISGLTTAVALTERGYATRVISDLPAERAASGAAAAIWYPYEAVPVELVASWALISYGRLLELARDDTSGVSLIEFRFFAKADEITVPIWAAAIGARHLEMSEIRPPYLSGFAISAPLMDGSVYLPYLRRRLLAAGGSLNEGCRLDRLEEADPDCTVVVNCTGYGAHAVVPDTGLEAHRGQIAIVEPLDRPTARYALVSVDDPLTYVIPRSSDSVLGGINEATDVTAIDENATRGILANCTRVLGTELHSPPVFKEARVGLRPYRPAGVRIEAERLQDGRLVVHNYGHAGAGFTLSWGCAQRVVELVGRFS